MPGTWIVAIFYNGNFNTAFATGSFTITALRALPSPSITRLRDAAVQPQWIFNCGSGCQDTGDGNIPSWTASGRWAFSAGSGSFQSPLPAAEGQTVAYLNSGTLSQTLSATLQASTAYTLQVDVGRRLDNLYPSTPPTAQLYAAACRSPRPRVRSRLWEVGRRGRGPTNRALRSAGRAGAEIVLACLPCRVISTMCGSPRCRERHGLHLFAFCQQRFHPCGRRDRQL